MAGAKRELEITLEELTLTKAAVSAAATRHVLTAGILWPRVGTARKLATLAVELADGCLPAGLPWSRRILFKETVQGRFAFETTLTEALSDEAAEAFLRAFAGQVLGAAAEGIENLAPPSAARLAGFPLAYLAKTVLKKPAPATLAAGILDLAADDLPAAGGSARWRLPLHTPEGIFRQVRRRAGHATRIIRRKIVPPGGEVGSLVVAALAL